MRRLGCFGMIIVLLLAVIAYDQWKINQLSLQMAAIATKVHAGKQAKAAPPKADLATTLAEAQKYTRQAQDFLKSKNVVQAQAELAKAKQKLDSASSFSKNIYDNSAQFLGKAKTRTEKVFKEAWKDISEKPKVESGKQKASHKEQSND